jgi:antirestriction protein ArdC
MNNTTQKKTVADILSARFIESLEKGVAPWSKPWLAAQPCNGKSLRPYSGFNLFVLGLFGGDDYFFTAQQVKELGGTLPSRKSVPVRFVKKSERIGKDGKKETYFISRFYTVWAAKDCSIPAEKWTRPPSKGCDFSPIEAADALASKSSCPLSFGGSRAFYSPSENRIQLPLKDSFKSPACYYGTLFHEIGHSLKEGKHDGSPFGSEEYAKEELVAELFASLCLNSCNLLGEEGLFDNSASYVGNWLKRLKNDPSLIIKASVEAGKRFARLTAEKEEEEGEAEEAGE